MRGIPGVMGLFLLGGLLGCASTKPPGELVSARQSYAHARTSGAASLAPEDLLEARKALDRAERSFAYDAESNETRWWAYIAGRKAERAEAQAGIAAAQRQRVAALQDYREVQAALERQNAAALAARTAQLSNAQRGLAVQGAQLQATTQQLDAERRARSDAERRAEMALEGLRNIGTLRQEPRGTVLTLSGSVVFTFGKAELLPSARQRLDQVADALKSEPGQRIVIEGHTDAIGSDEANQRLSQERAEAVRSYLVSKGVPAEMISAVGRGESQPVADNGTPEGRANNRRVEVVLQRVGSSEALPQKGPAPGEGVPPPGQAPKDEWPYERDQHQTPR